MDQDFNENYDAKCPQCGNFPTRNRECQAWCNDGLCDMAEDDPINFTPGEEVYICETCYGTGIETWCPHCGCDISKYHFDKENT